ncbi:MAG: polymer-forming cytoskeletal protein, partial [Polyangiaceae bacterium]
MKRTQMWAGKIGIALALLLASTAAQASVKLEGTWPDADKSISIDASGLSRSEAVRKIADAAGWSIVVHAPSGDPIDLHLKNQPATKVLDLVLDDASYVAKRDGTLISIERASEAAAPPAVTASAQVVTPPPPATVEIATPPVPPPPAPALSVTPPAPPSAATAPGEDRLITGGSLRIEKGETVKNVTVVGGSVDVLGDVTGDLTVAGGSAHVRKGGHVHGAATAIGGSLDIEDGAIVDGDCGVVGGVLTRAPGAMIHGNVVQGKGLKHDVKIDLEDSNPTDGPPGFSVHRTVRGVGSALTRSAILFVFGAMLLALGTDRMERLRLEIASRPMRSFALGIIGLVAACLSVIVLCVTVIGIPIAIVASLVAVFAGYAGFCAALTTGG